jgi:hypothetical protein
MNQGIKSHNLTSGICHSTTTVVLSAMHSTTIDYHHDSTKVDIQMVLMHSTVLINSYNINAQSIIQ